ncbi:MAG: Ferritin-like [Frankiales bacterium]|nr:Ferritin-like [Frankiales bacterium]
MTAARLKELLAAAVKLELATIPPYLCALYSIRPGSNQQATLVLRSVVVEEMLHMVLAANVLNAIGGRPQVAGREHAPHYPHELPDGVILDLLPFSPAAIESFLQVENPQYLPTLTAPDSAALQVRRPELHTSHAVAVSERPTTIGAFYQEITETLKAVAADIGEPALFCGDPARQIGAEFYYAGGGSPTRVTDLESACRALDEVVDQGEGDILSPYDADGDLAHYFRFQQLKYNRSYLAADEIGTPTGPAMGVDFKTVYPMLANPRTAEYDDPDLKAASVRANHSWSQLLQQLDAAFDGRPDALLPAVHTMFRLRDAMLVLLANPLPDHHGRHAGPTFEWQPFTTAKAGTNHDLSP